MIRHQYVANQIDSIIKIIKSIYLGNIFFLISKLEELRSLVFKISLIDSSFGDKYIFKYERKTR